MQIKATPLRHNGFKLSFKDASAREPLSGELIIHQRWVSETKTRLAAEIRKAGSVIEDEANLVALLYEPKVSHLQGAMFRLTGWEIINWKTEGRQLVVQEWACTIDRL